MIRTFFAKLIPKGSTAHSVSLIAGGTAIAQILNIATMPLFSRIYSPADFGILALFTSVSAILVEVSGLRYHLAIPLPKKNVFARSLVVLSFFIQCIFVAIITIGFYFSKDFLLGLVSAEPLIPYWFLIPIGIGGMGFYLTLTQWAVREEEFTLIARTRLAQSFWGITTKLVFGLLGFKPLGLLLGAIASQAGGVSTLAKKLVGKNGLPKADKTQLKRVAIKYRNFPLFSTWAGTLNTLGRQVTPIMLVAFYGAETAGLFAFGMQILQLPAVFIGQAIGQVFVQKASVAKYEGNLAEVSLKTFEALLQIGTFPIICLCLIAPDLFSFVFGEEWYVAGEFSRFLGPWILFMFVFSPISSLYSIIQKQKVDLVFQLINIAGRVSAVYLGYIYGGASLSILFYGGVSFIFVVCVTCWILKEAGASVEKVLSTSFFTLLKALLLLLPIVVLLLYSVEFVVIFAVTMILSIVYLFFTVKKLRYIRS